MTFKIHGNRDRTVTPVSTAPGRVLYTDEQGELQSIESPTVESAKAEYVDGDIDEDELEEKILCALQNEPYDE